MVNNDMLPLFAILNIHIEVYSSIKGFILNCLRRTKEVEVRPTDRYYAKEK